MKQIFSPLLCLSLLFFGTVTRAENKTLRPKLASDSLVILTHGKVHSYFPLASARKTVISVEGPGKLRVITRARFVPKEDDRVEYVVTYRIDGGSNHEVEVTDVGRSREAAYRDTTLGVPGVLKDFAINLGRGRRVLEFFIQDTLPPVAARFLFTPKAGRKKKWVHLEPLAPTEPVELVANEQVTRYYRFSSEKPLRIRIIGPTQLRIFTRVENSYDMRGSAHYRVQVRQNGVVMNTYQLASTRSQTTTYKNNVRLVPGKAREITLAVPAGRQVYELLPVDQDKRTLLGQVHFPYKDIRLEE
jgi:hypothetical protein